MSFSFIKPLPQNNNQRNAKEIADAITELRDGLTTFNPDDLILPSKVGNNLRALRLNSGATALEYKKVATLDSTTLLDKDLIFYNNSSGDFTRLAQGANGTSLQVSGGAYTFATLPAGALTVTSIQTTGFTATDGVLYPCDTTGAGFTVVLPPTPTAGQRVAIVDIAGAASRNNITVDRNGSEIMDLAENMSIDIDYAKVYLVYNATRGWLIL